MPQWIGHIIGKVRIEKFLERGGMAEVYLGTHLTLDRPVAVKILHSHIESDPDLMARFQREAKVVASLRHPNIIQVFDFDTHEGHPYIVMEYIKGQSLASYLKRLHNLGQRLSFEQTGRILSSLASGIDYAHSHMTIHRDVKPANILLHSKSRDFSGDTPITESVEPILTDFGLVRMAHSKIKTESGLVSGTPAYMSPEQARGDKIDHRTDIYSLGIVLYELLAGRVPFDGDSAMAIIYKHINEPPPRITDIPPQLYAVIDRALAKNPDDRYQNAREMAEEFYEVIGMRAESKTVAPQVRPPSWLASSKRRDPVWMSAAIFTCACLSVVLLAGMGISALTFLPRVRSAQANPSPNPTPTLPTQEHQKEPTSVSFIPETGASSVGVLRFQNGTAVMDQITINATLAALPENRQYQAWIIDDGRERSRNLGVLEKKADNQFGLTFTAPESQNLLSDFNRMEITLEPSPDDNPNSSRNVVYSSLIPPASLDHIRHLLVVTDETPGQIPMATGLVNNVMLINQAAEAMMEAFNAGDRATMRSNAEAIVNIIVGKDDLQFYNDWDLDGTVTNPGDGYGLLINGGQGGYLDGMIHHASYAADASGATSQIKMHAGHVEICIQNLEAWAPELRDLALSIARASDTQDVTVDLRKATTLANQMLNGIDVDGNESVDPIPGEGGAVTAFEHAEYMPDMPILQGEDQIPSP